MIFRSNDGTLIFCESFLVDKPRGSLLLVHGLGEHSSRYGHFIRECAKLHLNVYCMDLRGHGRSQGIRGHFLSIDEHHEDLTAWINDLSDRGELRSDLPCFLFGHSLGGLIAYSFVPKFPHGPKNPALTGLVLSAPAMGLKLNLFTNIEAQLANKIPAFFRSIQVPSGISAEQLSHDKKVVEEYKNDPMVHGWITPAAFLAMEKEMRNITKWIPNINLPTLFIVPCKDTVVSPDATLHLAGKLSVAHPGKVEVKKFHSFFHESFNEVKKERAFFELKKWIRKWLTSHKVAPSKKNSSKSSAKGAIERETLH